MNLDWFRQHLLACPFKYITGIDCPGCGLQRSFLELLQGNIQKSFLLYPGLIPFLITLVFLILHLRFRFVNGAKILLALFIFSGSIIVISYILNQVRFHSHL